MLNSPRKAARILCVTLRAGSVGHAVLDGFGVAEGSFFTRRLDHLAPPRRLAAIVRLIKASCRRFAATRIVLGLPGACCPQRLDLATRLQERLSPLRRVVVSVRRLSDAASVLVERVRLRMSEELIERLAKHVVPDLAPFVERARRTPRYWRAAWYAVAVAFAELVALHPLDAAALAQPGAFTLRAFRTALARALEPRV